METGTARPNNEQSARIRMRAAVWVTALHGPNRSARLEEKVRRWIAEDSRHAAAFESATRAWERSGELPAPFMNQPSRRTAARFAVTGGVAATLSCGAVLWVLHITSANTVETGAGQQKTQVLSDGTVVVLNANSRLELRFDRDTRRVILAQGEAVFDVAKHQPRPFVVVVGDRKVVAVGTSFLARREQPAGTEFAVTLLEGRIAVEPIAWPDVLPATFVDGLQLLNPGERLRFESSGAGRVDSPAIDTLTAWRYHKLIFKDNSLSEAAADFNGFNTKKITLRGAGTEKIRVGGVFAIDDPASFVRAVATTYDLQVTDLGSEFILTKYIGEENH